VPKPKVPPSHEVILATLRDMPRRSRIRLLGTVVYRRTDGGMTVWISGVSRRYSANTDAARSIRAHKHTEPVEGNVW
jgi:hypothetical protein